LVYLYWPKGVGGSNGGHVSVSVGHRRIFSAQWRSYVYVHKYLWDLKTDGS